MTANNIKSLFEPKSVAVVGASRDAAKFGSIIAQNMVDLDYKGDLFIVNPRAGVDEIRGVRCYPSIRAYGKPVDVVILAIPASAVIAVMQECAECGVKNVVVISSGFNESGEEGEKRLEEMKAIAKKAGIRILGPNTTGILNPNTGFTTTFVQLNKGLKTGSVAFISQTGIFAGVMLKYILTSERFGMSCVAGLGNKCDVDDSDVLEYLYDDEDTRAVMIYMEGTSNGRRFLKTAGRFTQKKPIVLLKGGRSESGAAAAFSHTGSLATRHEVVEDVFEREGIIMAHDLEQMIDYAKILSFQKVSRGTRLGIVTLSGGAAVMASDIMEEVGLQVASMTRDELSDIQKLYPEWATVNHPLDVEPLSETIGGNEAYMMGLKTVLKSDNVDMALLIIGLGWLSEETDMKLVDVLSPILNTATKPIAVCLIGPRSNCDRVIALLEEMKVPVYTSLTRAVRSLAVLANYGKIRDRIAV